MIVRALRDAGATVRSLAAVGDGCPDLLVGFRGANYLIEVKDPAQDPNKRKLTPKQAVFFNEWRGQRDTIETVTQALAVVGIVI